MLVKFQIFPTRRLAKLERNIASLNTLPPHHQGVWCYICTSSLKSQGLELISWQARGAPTSFQDKGVKLRIVPHCCHSHLFAAVGSFPPSIFASFDTLHQRRVRGLILNNNLSVVFFGTLQVHHSYTNHKKKM